MNELRLIAPGRRELRLDPGGARELRLAIPARRELRLLRSGMQGPQGAAGPAGGAPTRIDASLAATWILPHNLGHAPMVQVFSEAGELVEADVFATTSQITVTFANPQTGFVLAA